MRKRKYILATLLLSLTMLSPNLIPIPAPTTIAQAASIQLSKSKLSMKTGDTKTLKITGTTKKITWSSSDKSIASVSSKGKVTAKNPGDVVITASVNGTKLTCKVTVVDAASSATKK